MPTADDSPILPAMTTVTLVGAGDTANVDSQLHELDLIQVFDVSTQKVKTVTIRALQVALGTSAI